MRSPRRLLLNKQRKLLQSLRRQIDFWKRAWSEENDDKISYFAEIDELRAVAKSARAFVAATEEHARVHDSMENPRSSTERDSVNLCGLEDRADEAYMKLCETLKSRKEGYDE